jgi:hypothetical protein
VRWPARRSGCFGAAHFGVLGGDQVLQAAVTADLAAQLRHRGLAPARLALACSSAMR